METAFYNTYAIPTQAEACAVAERWGKEDALAGLDNNAVAYYIPDSPEWHAYAVGYLHGQRQARNSTQDRTTVPPPQPLPAPPGLWALRGYEDALFENPIRPALPDNATDRNDYLQGYQEGAAMLQRILSAPPPLIPVDDDQPIFYFKSTTKQVRMSKESNNE